MALTTIERMFVLGIDPGLTRCGYGLVARGSSSTSPFRALAAGVLESAPSWAVERRLGQLATEIEELMDELRPDVVSVERIFFQSNRASAVIVAQASGVVIALAERRGVATVQYSPNEVKQAVVGHGGATKVQVQSMVARLCGLSDAPKPADAADALAIGLCHLTSRRLVESITSSTL